MLKDDDLKNNQDGENAPTSSEDANGNINTAGWQNLLDKLFVVLGKQKFLGPRAIKRLQDKEQGRSR